MLLQTSFYLILATYLSSIKSQPSSTTCTNPNGCTYHCAKSNPCTNTTYNCTSIASSCTLNCLSCNGTAIISSAKDFYLICVGIHGCTNMDITASTKENHIHIITASEPTTSPTPAPTALINESIIPIHQYITTKPTTSPITTTINTIKNTIFEGGGIAAVEQEEHIDAIGGLLTFAGILTGMFCFCICIGICFVCHTKRKSKLRKNTYNENQYETVDIEYDKEQTVTQKSEIIQELEKKITKRLIVNNQTLTHINTNVSNTSNDLNKLQITKTITPFSVNETYDINNNDLIKQITPRVPIGNTISSYNEDKKLNESDSESTSETEVNDDSIDVNDITFNPGEPVVMKGIHNKGKRYSKVESVTNGFSINIENVRDDMDDDDGSDIEDALPMKPEKSSSVQDLVAMYNNL